MLHSTYLLQVHLLSRQRRCGPRQCGAFTHEQNVQTWLLIGERLSPSPGKYSVNHTHTAPLLHSALYSWPSLVHGKYMAANPACKKNDMNKEQYYI